ncbi:MAG: hypothetical protein ACYC46_13125 [Acidobacteriaceae bacterium]
MARTIGKTFQLVLLGISTAVALLGVTGCQSKTAATTENFTAALNKYFAAHPDCLFADAPRFPYETSKPEMIRKMDALASAQLLVRQQDRSIGANRYTLTPAGSRVPPKFCYGYRVITSIDSFTPPAKVNGFPETQVSYHYTMKDIPVWAKTPEVEKAFPAMAQAISGKAASKTTLAQTLAGWQVPD